jgi:excisionase family DNA binding protein
MSNVTGVRLWSKGKAAEYLGVSAPTLNKILAAGGIASTRIHKRVMLRPADVKAYINRGFEEGVAITRRKERA